MLPETAKDFKNKQKLLFRENLKNIVSGNNVGNKKEQANNLMRLLTFLGK